MSEGQWKEVNSSTDEMWDKKEAIEGIYTSKKEEVGPNKSNIYVIKVGEKNVGVWGSTVIDSKMEDVELGVELRIEYVGEATGKSGKTYADYKVMYKPTPFEEVFGKGENE